ncbi:MAG: hypothetical protein ACRDYA_07825 [Egibacteraceae bacterium]
MDRLREERGLAGAMLIVVIVWALLAVFMLTRTLVSAQQIEARVVKINEEVTPIDTDLDSARLAETTAQVANEIETAALPLTERLDEVVTTVPNINKSATSILDTAGGINKTVLEINKTVVPLGETVGSINANAVSINREVKSIETNALSINEHVDDIFDDLSGVLNTAEKANDGVEGINRRADIVIANSRSLGRNLDIINNEVVPSIDEHANEIDCTVVVKTLADLRTVLSKGRGSACNR